MSPEVVMQLIQFDGGTRRVGAGVMLCALLVGAPSQGSAQQPVPGPTQPPASSAPGSVAVAAYRLPTIALVQPPGAATLPSDRPVVVFRFAPGEPNDPIDLASFAVTVDGRDRTVAFQITSTEAWGSLAGGDVAGGDSLLALGTHQLGARICSARGACGVLVTSLMIVPSQIVAPPSHPAAEGAAADSSNSASFRRRHVIDVILAALRKLLSP
jgi:hypothetical protein